MRHQTKLWITGLFVSLLAYNSVVIAMVTVGDARNFAILLAVGFAAAGIPMTIVGLSDGREEAGERDEAGESEGTPVPGRGGIGAAGRRTVRDQRTRRCVTGS